jgi:hypothetical protein
MSESAPPRHERIMPVLIAAAHAEVPFGICWTGVILARPGAIARLRLNLSQARRRSARLTG